MLLKLGEDLKKAFVVGGAGFIGGHITMKLLSKGVDVSILTLPSDKIDAKTFAKVKVHQADFDKLSDAKLKNMLVGHDALVYAAGKDDRSLPPADVKAFDYYYQSLVTRAGRVVKIAKQAKIKKVIILGSYFSYFDRIGLDDLKPLELSEHHPYIRARVAQEKELVELGDDKFAVSFLEIPYVFGSFVNRIPLWKKVYYDVFKNNKTVWYAKGGTNAINVELLAQLAVGACVYANNGDLLPVGDQNMKLKTILSQFYQYLGDKKKIKIVPNWIMRILLKLAALQYKKDKRQPGLNYDYLVDDILGRDLYFEAKKVHDYLHLEQIFPNDKKSVSAGIKDAAEAIKRSL